MTEFEIVDYTPPPSARNLQWSARRWHCAGRPIHAGCGMELRARMLYRWDDATERHVEIGPGPWMSVRIESRESGRVLTAHRLLDGVGFAVDVGPDHELRWP